MIDEWDINKMSPTDYAIIGDVQLSLRALIDKLKKDPTHKHNKSLLEEIKNSKNDFDNEYNEYLHSSDIPINPYRVYFGLQNLSLIHI